jgi:hypothetical protein
LRAFACPHCRALLFFENSVCVTCGSSVGYSRDAAELVLLSPADGRFACANSDIAACNWISAGGGLCPSCALTRTRPPDGDELLPAFARAEAAKRRLVYQLDSLGLPITSRAADPAGGLAFDMLSSARGPITTGHQDGVVTVDLAEGEDPHREALRVSLDEPYRTLLGHLRHEIGHWYWARLVDGVRTEEFRRIFGDERRDYSAALSAHYGSAPGEGWADEFVSAYAAAHPWEDWAETFAHYLHIRDTLQTAAAFGMSVAGPDLPIQTSGSLAAVPNEDGADFVDLVSTWLPLSYALNAVNRSMGKDDLYPFVLSPAVLAKVRYVHEVVTASATVLGRSAQS